MGIRKQLTFTYISSYFISTTFDPGFTIKSNAVCLAQPYLNSRQYGNIQTIQIDISSSSNKITIDIANMNGAWASGTTLSLYFYIIVINK